ncbi:MAG: M24 family metallopeptidase [Candidatus Aminicenantes bacterium]|jgi:Xaa-Pro aminopeptidase
MTGKKTILLSVILIGVFAFNSFGQDAAENRAIANMIRADKFDFVLPNAMRNNNIDMWIIIDKGRGTEPLFRDFGFATSNGNGIFIFTDRGEKRIERAILGGEPEMLVESKTYDIFDRISNLGSFVKERNPQRIGINISTATELWPPEGRHLSDGLSHTDYINLKKALGQPYASRLVSAEKLISDFRSQRVAGEIIEFAQIANITRRLIERALSNEVITPGKTTMNDVCRWLEEQQKAHGVERGWHPTVFLSPPDGIEIANTDHVIQRGDVLQIDYGLGQNNFFTDLKRFSYVLKGGETEIPDWVRKAFDNSRIIRELIRENVRSGKTGREQLDNLKRLVEESGFVYTEEEHPSDVEGIEVNIGMHSAGNLGHDVGGSLFEIFPLRTTYEIRPNSLIAFEFIVFTPAEEWGGNKVPVCIEENALITDRGIEWIHPPQEKVLVIR